MPVDLKRIRAGLCARLFVVRSGSECPAQPSLKQRNHPRQHIIEQRRRQRIDLAPASFRYVEHAELIAADHAGGLDAGDLHRKADPPGKVEKIYVYQLKRING